MLLVFIRRTDFRSGGQFLVERESDFYLQLEDEINVKVTVAAGWA